MARASDGIKASKGSPKFGASCILQKNTLPSLSSAEIRGYKNVKIPLWLDRSTRKLLMTPNKHRIQHSTILQDNISNFGVIFSLWDRLLNTYRDKSVKPG